MAPVSAELGYNLPGGAAPSRARITESGAPLDRAAETAEEIVVASLFRSAGGASSGAEGAFERIGLPVSDGVRSVALTGGPDGSAPAFNPYAVHETLDKADAGAFRAALDKVGAKAGWTFDYLPTPPAQYHASDCFDYLTARGRNDKNSEAEITQQAIFTRRGRLGLPADIHQIDVVAGTRGDVLIGRASCGSGATGGTLRGISGLFVMELTRGGQPAKMTDMFVMDHGYLGADFTPQFHDDPLAARLYGRTLLLYTPRAGGIALVDLDTRKVVRMWRDLPSGDLLAEAYMTQDGNHVVQVNTDGSFALHRISDGKAPLTGRIVDDEIAVWTPDYRFDATAEAAALIDLRFPGLAGQFSLDRFDPVLHAPGLVASVLDAAPVPARPVPLPPDLSGRVSALGADRVEAVVTLTPGRAASEVQLYQDGVLTDAWPVPSGLDRLTLGAARLPGSRHASVVARSASGLASNPLTADLGPATAGGLRRALTVAVDLYRDDALPDLNYAKADADRLMRALSSLPASAPAFEVPRFVGGRRAAPADVLAAIDDSLSGLGPSDHLVLFFAGHGLRGPDGAFYLAMHGTDMNDLPGTALPFASVADRLAQTRARVTILIDACHSGSAGTGAFATNDGAIAGLSSVPSNVTLMAASKGRQLSIEAAALQGGLFTVALERVLVGERDRFDRDGNGRIEASELATGVRTIVEGQSEGRQVPWMTKGRVVGDYALF